MSSKQEIQTALENDWMTAIAAARLLDRTPQMVWVMGREGKIDTITLPNGKHLYSRQDVERILAEREGGR